MKVWSASQTAEHESLEKEFFKLQEAHRNLLNKDQLTIK